MVNIQQCFALSVSCSASEQKIVHQQFLVEMTHVAFEDLFRYRVQKFTVLNGGTEKAPAGQNANLRHGNNSMTSYTQLGLNLSG